MPQETDVTWLPREAYDRLSRELEELSGPGRTEIVKRIEQAREEGDLKENGGYHAAKEEQGKIEARIRQLTQLLRHAEVRESAAADGHVASGTVVVPVPPPAGTATSTRPTVEWSSASASMVQSSGFEEPATDHDTETAVSPCTVKARVVRSSWSPVAPPTPLHTPHATTATTPVMTSSQAVSRLLRRARGARP